MSRTFRNRRSIPHGWVVRDDGYPYHHSSPNEPFLDIGPNQDGWGWGGNRKPRGRRYSPPYRRHWLGKETAFWRRYTHRAYRAKTRLLLKTERWDDIAPFRSTGGWLSW